MTAPLAGEGKNAAANSKRAARGTRMASASDGLRPPDRGKLAQAKREVELWSGVNLDTGACLRGGDEFELPLVRRHREALHDMQDFGLDQVFAQAADCCKRA